MESARYQDYLHVHESGSSSSSVCQTPAMTWLDRDLFNYFYYFLETKGHVNVLDMELHDYTKLLPKSYQARIHSLGGLNNYLCFDPRFKISQDIVSIAGVDKNEWVDVPDLPTTSQHVLSTASVYTQKDRTTKRHKDVPTQASVNREFSNLSVSESLLNSSRSDLCERSEHQSHHQLQDIAEFKKELQTMFMELKGELDFLKHNLASKDSRKCCHETISHNMLLVDELKWDNRKLKAIIQKAEASQEIWKTSYDVLLKEHNDLQTINHAQIVALNKQLESETTKSFNTEMRLVDMGKMATLHKIDLKIMEADSYVKMLVSAINQINPVMSLPKAVYKKHEELCCYINTCNNLKHQVEETAQRLKNNLNCGVTIDISDIEISLPAVPVPHSQAALSHEFSAISNNGFHASSNKKCHALFIKESHAPTSNGCHVLSNSESHTFFESESQTFCDSESLDFPNSESLDFPNSESLDFPNSESLDFPNNEPLDLIKNELLDFSNSGSLDFSDSEHLDSLNSGSLALSDRVTPSDNEHLASSNINHLAPSNKEHLAPSNKEHLVPSNKKHLAPSNKEHLAPSNKEHLAPSNKEHLAPSNKKHMVQSNKEHPAPSNKEHLAPFSKKHLAPSSKKHLAHYNSEHLVPSYNEHLAPYNTEHLVPSYNEHLAPTINPSHANYIKTFPAHIRETLKKDTPSQISKSDVTELDPHILLNFHAQLAGHSAGVHQDFSCTQEPNDDYIQQYSRLSAEQTNINQHQLPQFMYGLYPLYSRPELT